jgi:transcriptional regulator with XRE-family HTH domain
MDSTQATDYRRGLTLPYLRAWRLARVLTQGELAERAGVSLGTVSNAEHGQPVQIPNIARLAKALGIDRVTLVNQSPELS